MFNALSFTLLPSIGASQWARNSLPSFLSPPSYGSHLCTLSPTLSFPSAITSEYDRLYVHADDLRSGSVRVSVFTESFL